MDVFLSGFSLIRTLARYHSSGIEVVDACVGCDVVMLPGNTPGLRCKTDSGGRCRWLELSLQKGLGSLWRCFDSVTGTCRPCFKATGLTKLPTRSSFILGQAPHN